MQLGVIKKVGQAATAVVLVVTGSTACDAEPSAQDQELERQQSNYTVLTESQPIEQMSYTPTRATINKWIETWDQPGKLAFMYLVGANGEYLGYYILLGLPVSYCTSGTPTYTWEDIPGDGSNTHARVPAPAMDGAYYSGNECDRYYGFEAETDKFLDWTVGEGINMFLLDEPVEGIETQPLPGGTVSADEVDTSTNTEE